MNLFFNDIFAKMTCRRVQSLDVDINEELLPLEEDEDWAIINGMEENSCDISGDDE